MIFLGSNSNFFINCVAEICPDSSQMNIWYCNVKLEFYKTAIDWLFLSSLYHTTNFLFKFLFVNKYFSPDPLIIKFYCIFKLHFVKIHTKRRKNTLICQFLLKFNLFSWNFSWNLTKVDILTCILNILTISTFFQTSIITILDLTPPHESLLLQF